MHKNRPLRTDKTEMCSISDFHFTDINCEGDLDGIEPVAEHAIGRFWARHMRQRFSTETRTGCDEAAMLDPTAKGSMMMEHR